MVLDDLSLAVQQGNAKKTKEWVIVAIEEKLSPEKILNEGFIGAMNEVGRKFKDGEIYVPEMLIAARAMAAGMTILEPLLVETGVKPLGKAVIGTVKGDLHDIGKNLVRMMMQGAGIEMYDIGIDAPAEAFIAKAEEVGADLICMSALLTTTMPYMEVVLKALNKAGVRDKYTVMIGGAPVTATFAKNIGADHYSPDAGSAAELARTLLQQKLA
jgi:5-methyltetrahydrofolate--homocysteine methyltransferase